MRESNFQAVEQENGVSPAWPISYSDLEPYCEKQFSIAFTAPLMATQPNRHALVRFLIHQSNMPRLCPSSFGASSSLARRKQRFRSAWIRGLGAVAFSVRPVMDIIARSTRRWTQRLQHCVRLPQAETSDC
jgi:hypothetical protein